MATEIKLPELGENVDEGEVVAPAGGREAEEPFAGIPPAGPSKLEPDSLATSDDPSAGGEELHDCPP